jgi:hypothetical protein
MAIARYKETAPEYREHTRSNCKWLQYSTSKLRDHLGRVDFNKIWPGESKLNSEFDF